MTRRRDKATAAKKPASRRPANRRDDDDDDEEDDEEEAPRTRRSSRSTTKRASTRNRRDEEEDDEDEEEDDDDAYDEDDEDEEDEEDEDEEEERPRRSSRSRSSRTSSRRGKADKSAIHPGVRSGWAGLDQVKSLFSQFPDRMFLDDEAQLVKILDSEPFAEFRQHWVPNEKGTGNRPYNCIEKGCPLCDIGADASAVIAFNVVHMNTGGEPMLKVLHLNITGATALQDAAKKSPSCKGKVDRHYWSIYKSGKSGKKGKGQTTQHFNVVKPQDLDEDWEGIEPLTEDEIADFKERAYTAADIDMPTRKKLRQVAEDLMDEDDEDEDD